MKKAIKLPLVLGVVCLVCTAGLAIVNEVTKDKIAGNIIAKQNAGYLTIYDLDSFDGYTLSNPAPSTALVDAGINKVLKIEQSGSLFGLAYDANVKGYAGELVFQVGFKDGNYIGFQVVKSNETSGFGADYLSVLTTYLKNKPASTSLEDLTSETIALKAGTTRTREPVLKAIYAAAQDYLTVKGA